MDALEKAQREVAGEALQVLRKQAKSLGFADFEPPVWESAQFRLERDPSDGKTALVATWYHKKGQRLGELTLRDDGHCYGECDLLRPHPRDPRWFVEGVTVWGTAGHMKGDPRLLPALGA